MENRGAISSPYGEQGVSAPLPSAPVPPPAPTHPANPIPALIKPENTPQEEPKVEHLMNTSKEIEKPPSLQPATALPPPPQPNNPPPALPMPHALPWDPPPPPPPTTTTTHATTTTPTSAPPPLSPPLIDAKHLGIAIELGILDKLSDDQALAHLASKPIPRQTQIMQAFLTFKPARAVALRQRLVHATIPRDNNAGIPCRTQLPPPPTQFPPPPPPIPPIPPATPPPATPHPCHAPSPCSADDEAHFP